MKYIRQINVAFLLTLSTSVSALEAISDDEMGNVTGQAFITINDSAYSSGSGEWAGNYEFTKVNFGLKGETLLNAGEVKLGKFQRNAYQDGTVPITNSNRTVVNQANGQPATYDADLIIQNFALGRVDNYTDGAAAEFVPFLINNPYIELAYKVENGERRVAGFRLGFANAQGDLSGDIISYTGKLEGEVRGSAQVAYDKTYPNGCVFLDVSCYALAIAGDTEIYSDIEPVDGSTGNGASNLGVQYLKRASWFGVRNDNTFQSDETGLIAALIPSLTKSDNCRILGDVESCFPSTIYQSIYVGDKGKDFATGSAKGLFISLQTESVPWEDLSEVPGTDRVLTQRGAFLNIARYQSGTETKYPLYLTLDEGVNGTPRVATCVGRLKGC
ncbi:MAG: hypothetical protein P1U57_02895 [Oleibacter sp.]|nr:hypothetical protein [Thalassolituus sp.]